VIGVAGHPVRAEGEHGVRPDVFDDRLNPPDALLDVDVGARPVAIVEPDVFVDGLACCDQPRARALVHAGLLRATRPGRIGERVPAVLTEAGYSILSAGGHPAHGLIA